MYEIEKNAIGPDAEIFTGYLAVVEKGESTFLTKTAQGFPKATGIFLSKPLRCDVMCQRLM